MRSLSNPVRVNQGFSIAELSPNQLRKRWLGFDSAFYTCWGTTAAGSSVGVASICSVGVERRWTSLMSQGEGASNPIDFRRRYSTWNSFRYIKSATFVILPSSMTWSLTEANLSPEIVATPSISALCTEG